MILRGESHALRDDLELMKRVRHISTIRILKQLQELYEARARRIEFERMRICEMSGIHQIEHEEYCHLIDLLDDWMRQPVRINFHGQDSKSKRRAARRVERAKRGQR